MWLEKKVYSKFKNFENLKTLKIYFENFFDWKFAQNLKFRKFIFPIFLNFSIKQVCGGNAIGGCIWSENDTK